MLEILNMFEPNTPLWDRIISIVHRILVEEHHVRNPFPFNGNRHEYEYLGPSRQNALLVDRDFLVGDLLSAANGLVHDPTSQHR